LLSISDTHMVKSTIKSIIRNQKRVYCESLDMLLSWFQSNGGFRDLHKMLPYLRHGVESNLLSSYITRLSQRLMSHYKISVNTLHTTWRYVIPWHSLCVCLSPQKKIEIKEPLRYSHLKRHFPYYPCVYICTTECMKTYQHSCASISLNT
jgi:hypothetical protein